MCAYVRLVFSNEPTTRLEDIAERFKATFGK